MVTKKIIPEKDHDKKRLVICTDNFLPRWDGISRFLFELIPNLKENFEITVIAPSFKGHENFDSTYEFKIVRIKTSSFSIGDYTPAKFKTSIIHDVIKDADIVFTQTIGPIGGSSLVIARRLGLPVISFIHSIEWELVPKSIGGFTFLKSPIVYIVKKIARNLYNRCDLIIVPSVEVREMFRFMKIRSSIEVVSLGVNTERFIPMVNKFKAKELVHLDPNKKVIGYVGRIGREKDVLTLYKAFIRLRRTNPNTILLIVGDGLKKIKNELRKDKNVIITGSTNDVIPYLQAMDAYVLPSLTETSSLSTMEAMSCGLAVVCTKVGSIKNYIIDKENGFIFPKKNDMVLSLKLKWLLENDSGRIALGKAARKTILEKYQWKETANKIKNIIHRY